MRATMKKLGLLPCLYLFLFTQAQSEQQPMIGQAAPFFSLKDLNGKTYSLENFNGKYLVIHFATTWCPFCNAEAPHLEQLYRDYKDKEVEVLIIDVKENKELVQNTFKKFNFSFPVLLDEDGKVAASYAPKDILPDLARDEVVLASNLIVDKEGKIRFYSLLDSKSFDAKLINARKKLDELFNSR
jgi:peroxiredoxin